VKFNLADGTEQTSIIKLLAIPFVGCINSVGDKITVNYNKENPAISNSILGLFLEKYGMYILVFLGIIFSIKPFLSYKKNQ